MGKGARTMANGKEGNAANATDAVDVTSPEFEHVFERELQVVRAGGGHDLKLESRIFDSRMRCGGSFRDAAVAFIRHRKRNLYSGCDCAAFMRAYRYFKKEKGNSNG